MNNLPGAVATLGVIEVRDNDLRRLGCGEHSRTVWHKRQGKREVLRSARGHEHRGLWAKGTLHTPREPKGWGARDNLEARLWTLLSWFRL